MTYTPRPITDGTELLALIRDSLRSNITHATDGLRAYDDDESISAQDALTLIRTDLEHTLTVVKASKDTI